MSDPSAKQALYLVVSGSVQGVGFRAFTRQQARVHRITGWVRNLDDGTVEIFAEADKKSLDAFVEAIAQGSDYSRVSEVKSQRALVQNLRDFSVVY